MTGRPRVIDMHEPHASLAMPFVCPSCDGALGWINRNDLRSVARPCRCQRGHVVHEVRCRECAMLLIVEDTPGRLRVVGRGGDAVKALERDAAVRAIEDRFERDR